MMSFGRLCIVFSVFAAVVAAGSFFLSVRDAPPSVRPQDIVPLPQSTAMTAESLRDSLPVGTRVDFCNMALRGWKLGGEFCLDMSESLAEVSALMAACGFSCRHAVGGCDDGRMLSEWEDADGARTIWALNRTAWNRTGFSWGVSE